MPIGDDNGSAGFVGGEADGTAWMDAEERPDGTPLLPEGLELLEESRPHPRRCRNGEHVEAARSFYVGAGFPATSTSTS